MKPNEILQEVLYHYKLNANQLAIKLNLKRAQVLYDILDGKSGISQKMAAKIVEVFPEINKAWLLTGEGIRIKNEVDKKLYDHNPEYLENVVSEADQPAAIESSSQSKSDELSMLKEGMLLLREIIAEKNKTIEDNRFTVDNLKLIIENKK